MKKTVAISTLQSLVSEHNGPIYQEDLDCIKNELKKTKPKPLNKQSSSCGCGAKFNPMTVFVCSECGFERPEK